MDQDLAEKVLGYRDMHHGSRGVVSVPKSELLHPPFDINLLRERLRPLPFGMRVHVEGRKKCSHQSGSGVVSVSNRESRSSEARYCHYREELYCGSDYGVDKDEEEAVIQALRLPHPGLPLP